MYITFQCWFCFIHFIQQWKCISAYAMQDTYADDTHEKTSKYAQTLRLEDLSKSKRGFWAIHLRMSMVSPEVLWSRNCQKQWDFQNLYFLEYEHQIKQQVLGCCKHKSCVRSLRQNVKENKNNIPLRDNTQNRMKQYYDIAKKKKNWKLWTEK